MLRSLAVLAMYIAILPSAYAQHFPLQGIETAQAVQCSRLAYWSVEQIKCFADRDERWAQLSLGIMYEEGQRVAQDYSEAARWYREASKHGDADAKNRLGILYENGRGVPQSNLEALKWYKDAADRHYPEAYVNLGAMYYLGKGVQRDPSEAARLFKEAYALGSRDAATKLGILYIAGEGVTQDYAEAEAYLKQAAEGDYPKAQYMLGLLYAEENWVKKNYVYAHMWTNLAIAGLRDSELIREAQQHREDVADKMTPNQLEQAQTLAREWSKKNRR